MKTKIGRESYSANFGFPSNLKLKIKQILLQPVESKYCLLFRCQPASFQNNTHYDNNIGKKSDRTNISVIET